MAKQPLYDCHSLCTNYSHDPRCKYFAASTKRAEDIAYFHFGSFQSVAPAPPQSEQPTHLAEGSIPGRLHEPLLEVLSELSATVIQLQLGKKVPMADDRVARAEALVSEIDFLSEVAPTAPPHVPANSIQQPTLTIGKNSVEGQNYEARAEGTAQPRTWEEKSGVSEHDVQTLLWGDERFSPLASAALTELLHRKRADAAPVTAPSPQPTAREWLEEKLRNSDSAIFRRYGFTVEAAIELLDAYTASLRSSHQKEIERLTVGLDQMNGINPACGHEWKFTDARGDEFEECIKCELAEARREIETLKAQLEGKNG